MRTFIAREEYCERVRRLQAEMDRLDLDAFFCYGTEGNHRNLTYLADYWPAFEVGGVLVGRSGLPLVLNATESLEYAATSAYGIDRVRQCRAFDPSESPVINPGVHLQTLSELVEEVACGKPVRRVGLGDFASIPHPLYLELQKMCGERGELVDCDWVMEELRMHKSAAEIELLESACILTERAFDRALEKVRPKMTQYEMQGVFTAELFKDGGEGPGFAMANFTGASTRCSIGRNRHIPSERNQLITVGFGCHFGGYCGSYSRPFLFGKMPDKLRREIDFMIDIHQKVAGEWLRPGATTGEVFQRYTEYFLKKGHGMPPGAPCHGIGIMEDEGPIFQSTAKDVLVPDMAIAVDNFFRTDAYGFRFEDVAVITETGARLFTSGNWRYIELL